MSNPATGAPVVLDASAVLALLFEEPGAEVVRAHLRTGVIGAANLAEVLTKLSDHGMPAQEAARAVAILGLDVMPMTETQADRDPSAALGRAAARHARERAQPGRPRLSGARRRIGRAGLDRRPRLERRGGGRRRAGDPVREGGPC